MADTPIDTGSAAIAARTGNRRPEWAVHFGAPGVSLSEGHDSLESATTKARSAVEQAQAGLPIIMTHRMDGQEVRLTDVGEVSVLRLCPDGIYRAHLRSWRRGSPAPDALEPLPADFWAEVEQQGGAR